MNAAVIAIIVLVLYFLGYRFYSSFLSKRIFRLSEDEITPAHELNDGRDFVPSHKQVLFGHHFASIAGAAPIIGPAIAVFWGWLPAIIWVCLGTIFMGAVHDFSALVISARNRGRSVGDLAGTLISPRARTLFFVIVYFLIFFVMAVFAYAIAALFVKFPSSVVPVNFQIVVAVLIGFLIYKKGVPILWPSIIALLLLYLMMWVGTKVPVHVPEIMGSQIVTWILFLLIYAFVSSVLPVWTLLQPRDYINSHHLRFGGQLPEALGLEGGPDLGAAGPPARGVRRDPGRSRLTQARRRMAEVGGAPRRRHRPSSPRPHGLRSADRRAGQSRLPGLRQLPHHLEMEPVELFRHCGGLPC